MPPLARLLDLVFPQELGLGLLGQDLDPLDAGQALVADDKLHGLEALDLAEGPPAPLAEGARGGVVHGVLDHVVVVDEGLAVEPEAGALVVEADLHGAGLHEQPAELPARGPHLLDAGGLVLEEVVLEAALAGDGLEDAQGEAHFHVGAAEGRGAVHLDVHVGPPEAPRLDAVLVAHVVAELDAGAAVEAPVRLLVDLRRAVGVGRDDAGREAVGLEGLGREGRRRGEWCAGDRGLAGRCCYCCCPRRRSCRRYCRRRTG